VKYAENDDVLHARTLQCKGAPGKTRPTKQVVQTGKRGEGKNETLHKENRVPLMVLGGIEICNHKPDLDGDSGDEASERRRSKGKKHSCKTNTAPGQNRGIKSVEKKKRPAFVGSQKMIIRSREPNRKTAAQAMRPNHGWLVLSNAQTNKKRRERKKSEGNPKKDINGESKGTFGTTGQKNVSKQGGATGGGNAPRSLRRGTGGTYCRHPNGAVNDRERAAGPSKEKRRE